MEITGLNTYDLTGRRAVVTGAAQGFGRAITERFLASGASVAMWDLDADETQRTAAALSTRGKVFTQTLDVASLSEVDAAAAATAEALGGIDILVANAGIAGPNHTTWEYPPDEWRRVIDIDLMSVFYCCRAVVPFMLQQKYGRIVTISSVAGKEGNANASAYSTAKAGVIALTKSLGKELAGENIAVNCITPAAAKTRIFEQMSQSHLDWMLSKIPRGRFLQIEELASLTAWLVSEENSFSTGAVFDISGGRSTY
jgi:2-dehydro-3-deoxy-L-rhamnonate dehydrogenase (NAD+)